MAKYVYNDEDNAPMNEEDLEKDDRDCPNCANHDGKYCQVWDCKFVPKEQPLPFTDPPDGCWNCWNYDGDHCTKNWNNMDESYYNPDEDDKEPEDWCEDFDRNEEIKPEEFFDDR